MDMDPPTGELLELDGSAAGAETEKTHRTPSASSVLTAM
jgi:hypothetical protein